jgi:hypothetical protein
MVKVNSKLQLEKVLELEDFFWEYKDVFGWTYKDLKGIDLLELTKHKIKLHTTIQPANHVRYRLNPNYVATMKQNIDKLLTTSFIQLVEEATCRNPTLAKCEGEAQHLEKVRIWSPLGLSNVQSSTARPKTPRIEVFLVSLERSWSVDIENGLALVIWTSIAHVMGKRRAGNQTGNLTPDH